MRMRTRTLAGVALALTLAAVLAGCVQEPEPEPSRSPSATATPTPTDAPPPTLIPDGSARDNLPYFDHVNQNLLAANGQPGGRDVIDNLVAAGFAKSEMEVTPDSTAIGGTADSVLFSVKVAGECLIGQVGGTGYQSTVQPLLSTGKCLVGQTRPIDW